MARWSHPIFVKLQGLRVVVVGGGGVAERKVRALLEAGASVTVVSPQVSAQIEAWSQDGRLRVERRPYEAGDLAGARLAYAATSDAAVNAAVRAEASGRGVWLNVVDVPDSCDFITPAVVRRGHLTIAVSTDGTAPGLARSIRQKLEVQFGPGCEAAVSEIGELRAAAIAEGRDPSSDTRLAGAVDRLGSNGAPAPAGKVWLVGAGPGDAGLITVKGLDLLRRADTVLYDALVDRELLGHCKPGARLVFVGKREKHHSFPQDEINQMLVEEARAGKAVVRLKGGDPFVFGRGGEEADVLVDAGIPFEVVPGVSAGVGVPAYAGIPLTHRGYTSELVFLTGHQCGSKPSPVDWSHYGDSRATLVIFMGTGNLREIAGELLTHGRAASCPVAVIENGATTRQRTITAPLHRIWDEAEAAGITAPALVVVGDVVALREKLAWYDEG
jgi:uroporphyrin-III C-methyltransferase/precorrin-2 dehydrogenase/sirohydrochlorin ferrochelatase